MSAVLAATAVLVLASCSGPFVVPTTMDECHRASPDFTDSAEGSSGLMLAYAETDHAIGAAGTLHVCLPHEGAATLSTAAPAGVGLSPDPLTVPSSGGVPELRVAVDEADADGDTITIGYDDGDLGAAVSVVIEVEGDAWSFTQP